MTGRVIIIGAGLGGLALAQGLKKANIPFSIYERDATKDVRLQGYRLRINPDGAAALRKTLPDDLWKLFQDTCALTSLGITTLDAITAEIQQRKPGGDQRRAGATGTQSDEVYTADRTTLRDLLLTGIDVQFGKEFIRYEIRDGKVVAHFAGGLMEEGDMLVGADGIYSRVRRQYLPTNIPNDTDGRAIYGKTPITTEFSERFTKDAMEWMTVISAPKSLSLVSEAIKFREDPAVVSSGALRSVKDYVYWVLLGQSDDFVPDNELFSLPSQQIAELSLKITQGWHPSIRALLELQQVEKTSVVRLTSTVPNPEKWQSSNITLLGDAVHCMPPTGGVGANTALRDAATLTEFLKDVGVEGIPEYEEKMRQYAGQAVARSLGAVEKIFNISLDKSRPLYG